MKKTIYLPDILDFSKFNYAEYWKGETEILNPQILNLGYKIIGKWETSDGDSFDPLSRSITIQDDDFSFSEAWYG